MMLQNKHKMPSFALAEVAELRAAILELLQATKPWAKSESSTVPRARCQVVRVRRIVPAWLV